MANLLQFQGGRMVGFATADLVQAYPLVSTIWDIWLFGEYRSADKNHGRVPGTNAVAAYLVIMYILYLGGITCMILSFKA